MSKSFWLDDDIRVLSKQLDMFDKRLLPMVVAETLNAPAEAIGKEARRNVKKDLIVRTNYTVNSIRQDRKARGNNISRMYSRVGTKSDYLWKHDEGETVKAKSSRIPIPTVGGARGGSLQSRIAGRYAMNRIELGKAFFMGKPKGAKMNRPLGIYLRHTGNTKLMMIRNLTKPSVDIPATGFFSKAVKKYGQEQYVKSVFKRIAKREIASRLGL